MDFSSPQVTAAFLTILSTFLITQVLGRWIDHNYDKLYRELEKNLKLREMMGKDWRDKNLEELIRRQLNAYIVSRSQESTGRVIMHKIILFVIGGATAGLLAGAVISMMDSHPWRSALFAVAASVVGMFYADRRSKWSRKGRVENTKYKAVFKGGSYSGGAVMIDVKQDEGNGLSELDYKSVGIEDREAGKVHVYKRSKSSGSVSIASGEDTDLTTEYDYEGTVSTSEAAIHSVARAVVPAGAVKTAGYSYPKTAEMPLIVKPIKDAVSTTKKVVRFFNNQ